MKKITHHFVFVLAAVFTLASCSQSQELSSSNQEDNTRRYYKEYVGNKIIYHNQPEKEAPAELDINMDETYAGGDLMTDRDRLGISTSMFDQSGEKELSEIKSENAASPGTLEDDKVLSAKKRIRWDNLFNVLQENHQNVVSGKVFTKKFHAERINKTTQVGASEIFGLLALIFGAASVSSFGAAAIGISFGVVAIVFGLLGQDAESFWGVFSLVGFILGIVGAALSFIFIFV